MTGSSSSVTEGLSGVDRLGVAALVGGFVLLTASLVGAYLQRPSVNPKPWLFRPAEKNAFAKLPTIQGNLMGVYFTDPLRGWAVGGLGTIVTTFDGGQTWLPQASGTTNDLRSVCGSGDARSLWAVGDGGTILHTTDGATWQKQASGTTEYLLSVYGSGDGSLWAVGTGGTILRTTDGGTWQKQTSGITNTLSSVSGSSNGRSLWAVGTGGTILHTTDGGTWQKQTSGTTDTLSSVYGSGDGRSLWAVGKGGIILHTTDGTTWEKQNSDTTNNLFSVYGSGDGRPLWAVGDGGTILHTTDGATWHEHTNGVKDSLIAVYGSGDGRSLWTVGEGGTILHTADGVTWRNQTGGASNDLTSVYGNAEGRSFWAVAFGGTILHTTDGAIWQKQTSGTADDLFSVYGSGDGRSLWVVGAGGTILHTTDGATWQKQPSGITEVLRSVYGSGDARSLWAVGWDGTILHTTDGANWQKQTSGTADDLFSVYGSGGGRSLWAVGRGGTILHTTDGATWQKQTSGTTNNIYSVYGSGDGRSLWAVGDRGTILHSTDGATWQKQTSGTTNLLYSIHGSGDGRSLWTVGWGGTILRTTDGATWQKQTSGTPIDLLSVYRSGDGRSLWAVGFGGTILHTTDGGNKWANGVKYSYRPAPWVWLALPLASTSLVFGLVRLQRPVAAPRQSIENAALSDRPATKLNQDLLDAADTVRALAEFLRNRNTEPPVTLSVEGSWGTGKTSVMRMLESELRRAHVPTAWFNAWHNEGEEQMLAFLLESIRRAFPRWWDIREAPFRLRLLAVRYKRWPVILFLLVVAALFIFHPVLDWLRQMDTDNVRRLRGVATWLEDRDWAQLVTIATAIGASIPLVRSLLRLATGISVQPSDLLSESGSKAGNSARTSFRIRFAREFEEATRALGPDRRITVFIDDLDRCQPEQVRQTLEAVNFLISSGGCFVVMGIARDIVEASVGLGFQEIAEELSEAHDDPDPGAAKRRRRAFASSYLQKLINLTIMLRPYSGEALSKVAASDAGVSERPSRFRQAAPYIFACAFASSAVLATVLLWDVAKLPAVPPKNEKLAEESYGLPGKLRPEQLKTVLIERDKNGKVLAERRTYDADQKVAEPKPVAPIVDHGAATSDRTGVRPGSSTGTGFQPGQTYSPEPWLWWMAPALLAGAGLTARGLLTRRLRIIRDSAGFREALGLWRAVYEDEIRTPREIKRFVNELRYKAIRFRGPQSAVPVFGDEGQDASGAATPREPALILFAILDRLLHNSDPQDARERLAPQYQDTFDTHLNLFGEPGSEDWDRYHRLFGGM